MRGMAWDSPGALLFDVEEAAVEENRRQVRRTIGVSHLLEQGRELMRQHDKPGNEYAAKLFGQVLQRNDRTELEEEEAKYWLEFMAAEKHWNLEMERIGAENAPPWLCVMQGRDCHEFDDEEDAYELFRRAADAGYGSGMIGLGEIYFGEERDEGKEEFIAKVTQSPGLLPHYGIWPILPKGSKEKEQYLQACFSSGCQDCGRVLVQLARKSEAPSSVQTVEMVERVGMISFSINVAFPEGFCFILENVGKGDMHVRFAFAKMLQSWGSVGIETDENTRMLVPTQKSIIRAELQWLLERGERYRVSALCWIWGAREEISATTKLNRDVVRMIAQLIYDGRFDDDANGTKT